MSHPLTEAIREAQRQREEAQIATVAADPKFKAIRPLLEQLVGGDWRPLDELISRVRRDLWRDLSTQD